MVIALLWLKKSHYFQPLLQFYFISGITVQGVNKYCDHVKYLVFSFKKLFLQIDVRVYNITQKSKNRCKIKFDSCQPEIPLY